MVTSVPFWFTEPVHDRARLGVRSLSEIQCPQLNSGLSDDCVQPPEVFCGPSPKNSRLGLTLEEIVE